MIFLKALFAGLAISAPMGPINVVCIKQTLRLGLVGFVVVAAASAVANLVLSGLAATGSLALVSWLKEYRVFLHFLAGAVLLGDGLAEVRATFAR